MNMHSARDGAGEAERDGTWHIAIHGSVARPKHSARRDVRATVSNSYIACQMDR